MRRKRAERIGVAALILAVVWAGAVESNIALGVILFAVHIGIALIALRKAGAIG